MGSGENFPPFDFSAAERGERDVYAISLNEICREG